ncbi:flagellin N-terminal helical domain-containing protein [Arthrobacter mobilis]|uniref:Flagellin n=1 Tax=Arthrobacter mobilis TaxID=2724944 RepID=A0A7X6K5L6_9MICC|nr:flagellin [Arthrobacter mobilis]NKX53603.1 flagellin [Arthrobacter mobilis]
MGFAINTNISALNSYRNLSNTQNDISKSLEKLSTGLRINRAADDAAGLSISEGLRSQVNGLNVAARNAQDGISVIQTAEGALTEVHSILQRMRDLAVQAGNDSNNADARAAIKTEVDGLTAELDRIGKTTNFDGTKLLNGENASLTFQVGADGNTDNQISVNLVKANLNTITEALDNGALGTEGTSFAIADHTALGTTATFTTTNNGVKTTVTTDPLDQTAGGAGWQSVEEYANALRADGNFSANFNVEVTKDTNGKGIGIVVSAKDGGQLLTADNGADASARAGLAAGVESTPMPGGLDFTDAASARNSINLIDAQIKTVSSARSELGAVQNRFEHTIKNLNVSSENLSASASRIRDTDMAKEMASFTRSQIMSQAGTAMLAQANQINQGVLQLLG